MTCPSCTTSLVQVGRFSVCPEHGIIKQGASIAIESISKDESEQSEIVSHENSPKFRIIHVDDEEAPRSAVRIVLTRFGYQIDSVGTGWELLARLRSNEYDFVLCDLKLPDCDGLDLIQSIKDEFPWLWVWAAAGFKDTE